MIGECNYGGRVTDTWDRRLLVSLLDDYINQEIVENSNYKFSSSLEFSAPGRIDLEHNKIMSFIENHVPTLPSPDVYGLHPNAGIQRDLDNSQTLLNSILILIQGTTSTKGDGDSEKNLLRSIIDIEARCDKFNVENIEKEKKFNLLNFLQSLTRI